MRRPWLKFYPADWRSDPSLRMCSIGARGLWMEMLCLMHEAEPRGDLLVKGATISEAKLASLVGATASQIIPLIRELQDAGVFSLDENGTIYSRRMRREEHKAGIDTANGRLGGNPRLKLVDKAGVNPHSNPRVNRGG